MEPVGTESTRVVLIPRTIYIVNNKQVKAVMWYAAVNTYIHNHYAFFVYTNVGIHKWTHTNRL